MANGVRRNLDELFVLLVLAAAVHPETSQTKALSDVG